MSSIRTAYNTLPHHQTGTGSVNSKTMVYQNDASSPPTSSPNPSQQQAENEAMRQAVLQLVGVWLNRLSLLSAITTFFAGIDGQLLSYAYPSTVTDSRTATGYRIATASLAGAVVLHWMAAIISYLGCFALYRYELIDARNEERQQAATSLPSKAYQTSPSLHASPTLYSSFTIPTNLNHTYISVARFHPFGAWASKASTAKKHGSVESPPATNSGIPKLPIDLIGVNNACVIITFVGFILALLGILAYIWSFLPSYVSIFSTVCLGVSMLVGIWVLR